MEPYEKVCSWRGERVKDIEGAHDEESVAHHAQANASRQQGFLVQHVEHDQRHEPAETFDEAVGEMFVPTHPWKDK